MKRILYISVCLSMMLTIFAPFTTPVVEAQSGDISAAEEARLRAELKELEKEIEEQQEILNIQKNRSASIERDVSVLRAEIQKARSTIRQQNIQINRLRNRIEEKKNTISSLENEIMQRKESLQRLLQLNHELDQSGTLHVMLSNQSLSEFYSDINSFASIKKEIHRSLEEIRHLQNLTEAERQELLKRQQQEIDAMRQAERQKQIVEESENEKQQLLNISRNKEQQYQQVLEERKAKAAEIRSALFRLRDAGPIPFGEAYEHAKVASNRTGVRPALILAILKQESNLGANVGTCYLKDTDTGDGVRINSNTPISRVMKPSRDVAPFLRITEKLGRDPFSTRVSCPWRIGYGGAMGPSQFIPSTWEIFEDRIAQIMGTTANPWNPRHAITATALYIQDLGGDSSSWTQQREAACKYYSGVSCYHPTVQNMFYGNSVMELADQLQKNIDVLESV